MTIFRMTGSPSVGSAYLNVPTKYLVWRAFCMDSGLQGRLEIWIPNIVSAPVSITSPGPCAHLFPLQFPITLLENGAKRCEVALNLEKILIRDLLPLRLQRCLELLPELSKLFLIHEYPPWLWNGRPNLFTAPCWKRVLWRKSGGDQENHTRREDGEARRIGQSAWLNTSRAAYTARGQESMVLYASFLFLWGSCLPFY